MGTAYIRVKFTPAVKYFPKTNSNNCWLEIIPTVSCIENLDRLEWGEHKGSVEYLVPMTYKIILKKREPKHQSRVYYSCIDLLSSVTSLNLSAGDVHRHISDNFIVSKTTNENFENKQDFGLKINSKKNDIKAHSKGDVSYLQNSKVQLTENIQVTNKSEHKIIEKDSILQEGQTETENKIDRRNSNDRNNAVSHINGNNKDKENVQKKLCLSKVCNISTAYEISCNNDVNTDFTTKPCFNPNVNILLGLDNIHTKNIKFMENIYRPFRDTLFNCFVRVEPEIRIAQFVENMEKEVFPLKVLLNDLLKKCATLGLKKSISSNVLGVNKFVKCNNKTFEVQKKVQSNRVVYSIVFDG